MPGYDRLDRLNEELRHVIDAVIREELHDPRIGGLYSITSVDVTRDLSLAKVRVSLMGEIKQRDALIAALEHAGAFIRREVRRRMSLRVVPELRFIADDGIAYSVEIGRKIDDILGTEETDGERAPE